MSAADRLDAIGGRMDRQIPALDIRDRNDLRATVAALWAALEVHKPRTDSAGSLVDWSFCSCGAMEVFVAEDGYNSVGPARYPCRTVRAITEALDVTP
jgi:hypothetical protein